MRVSQARRALKAHIRNALGKIGLEPVRHDTTIHDARGSTTDPIEAAARAGLRPFLVDVPLGDCRIMPGAAFACAAGVGNPFVDTLSQHAAGTLNGYAGSPLDRFHNNWQPKSAAQVLGVGQSGLGSGLETVGPFGMIMPFSPQSPGDAERRWRQMIDNDNSEHAITGDAAMGWKGWGPVSSELGEAEIVRLTRVFASIRDRGYIRDDTRDGDIKGMVLFDGTGFRVMVTGGHHRAAALAVLGHATAPIRIDHPIARRAEVDHWPAVRSGYFDTTAALAVFDRIFAGRQPWSTT